MLFYRNIVSQNLFTYLPCCFIVTFCHKSYSPILPCCFIVIFCYKIYSPTYHAVLSQPFVTKFVHLPTMLFYRNILSQNLFTYQTCCFIVTFCHKIYSPTLPCCFIVTFCHKICSPTYHGFLS